MTTIYEDEIILSDNDEDQQVVGRRKVKVGGVITEVVDTLYATFDSIEALDYIDGLLHKLPPKYFPKPIGKVLPRLHTKFKATLVFKFPAMKLDSWIGALPRADTCPCKERRDMIRHLFHSQYLVGKKFEDVTITHDAGEIFLNRNATPQIIRLKKGDKELRIAQLTQLLQTIHGSAERNEFHRADFESVLQNVLCNNNNSVDDLCKVYYHPFLWTTAETISFYKNIGDRDAHEYGDYYLDIPYKWKQVVRVYQGDRTDLYVERLVEQDAKYADTIFGFFTYMRDLYSHINSYFSNNALLETVVIGEIQAMVPDMLVLATNALLDCNADEFEKDIFNNWI